MLLIIPVVFKYKKKKTIFLCVEFIFMMLLEIYFCQYLYAIEMYVIRVLKIPLNGNLAAHYEEEGFRTTQLDHTFPFPSKLSL